jgi:hypothetical protein
MGQSENSNAAYTDYVRLRVLGTSAWLMIESYLVFQPVINAESVFSSIVDESVVYLIIYVDDILLVAALESALTRVKIILAKLYEIMDLGNAEYYLGVKIEREK